MYVKCKRLTDTAKIPKRMTQGAAGFDVYADLQKQVLIPPSSMYLISTGIALEIPYGFMGMIVSRSSMVLKRRIRVANAPGIIDSDYRGEVGVLLENSSPDYQAINHGDRIAQILIVSTSNYAVATVMKEVEQLSETERAEGGFGSTGTR